jgi:HPt (histidine-containing phosphotransfer) domain-containing protein
MNDHISNITNIKDPIDIKLLESLRDMLGSDEVVFAKVVQCYLTESSQLIEDISGSIINQNPKTLEQTAHKLKSSSAALGAVILSRLCLQLEMMGQRGDLAGVLEVVSQLNQEYQKVAITLQQTINKN